jgi:hypothetical protein
VEYCLTETFRIQEWFAAIELDLWFVAFRWRVMIVKSGKGVDASLDHRRCHFLWAEGVGGVPVLETVCAIKVAAVTQNEVEHPDIAVALHRRCEVYWRLFLVLVRRHNETRFYEVPQDLCCVVGLCREQVGEIYLGYVAAGECAQPVG